MENSRIRIWIRMKNFWIQDADPYDNSYGSASLMECYLASWLPAGDHNDLSQRPRQEPVNSGHRGQVAVQGATQ